MDAGPTLFTAIGITLVIIVVVQLGLYNMRKRHKEAYPKLWDAFKKAVKEKNQLEIIRIGNELIYNTYLLQEHLSIIHKTAIELEKKDAQFESLRLNAYNKQLHYNRPLPGAFSSGGVEQTWFRRN